MNAKNRMTVYATPHESYTPDYTVKQHVERDAEGNFHADPAVIYLTLNNRMRVTLAHSIFLAWDKDNLMEELLKFTDRDDLINNVQNSPLGLVYGKDIELLPETELPSRETVLELINDPETDIRVNDDKEDAATGKPALNITLTFSREVRNSWCVNWKPNPSEKVEV